MDFMARKALYTLTLSYDTKRTICVFLSFFVQIRVTVSQIAIGLPCLANLVLGTFGVAWFTLLAIAGSEYLRQLSPACNAVTGLFVWTGVLYLTGFVTLYTEQWLK